MWTYHEGRDMCYLHQYAEEEPDLDLRNENVKAEMLKVLDFYLELGADGFRVNSVNLLVEVGNFGSAPAYDGLGDVTLRSNLDLKALAMNRVR